MSIVDAIQRAKQLGRKPEPLRGGTYRPQMDAHSATQAEALDEKLSGPVSPSVVAEAVPRAERRQFAELRYDTFACTDKHIIVPGVDEQMLQNAAPPYRMLRARLLQLSRSQGWSSLAITSPGPGEGKSVTAINLAVSIAKEGNHDVFLLDLDMRNPSVCRYLGVAPTHELTDFFNNKATAYDVFFTIGIERLTISGCVTGTPHASELLATNHLEQLLAYIRSVSANPLILIDLPPVVITDDALVVIPRVDATVLVVSEGTTKREGLERAVALLASSRVAGVVLNRTSESIGSEYYRTTGSEAGTAI